MGGGWPCCCLLSSSSSSSSSSRSISQSSASLSHSSIGPTFTCSECGGNVPSAFSGVLTSSIGGAFIFPAGTYIVTLNPCGSPSCCAYYYPNIVVNSINFGLQTGSILNIWNGSFGGSAVYELNGLGTYTCSQSFTVNYTGGVLTGPSTITWNPII